jgi:phenylacetate-CoA ligase
MIRHAARTSGFFKVRGININHADFEDFMHRRLDITDFKVEVEKTETLDLMRVSIEVSNPVKAENSLTSLREDIRKIFELSPEIAVLDAGTLEQELQSQVKQQRFVDKRG